MIIKNFEERFVSFNFLFSTFILDVTTLILFTFRDYLALNVYVALCYYKLDYFDVSQVFILSVKLFIRDIPGEPKKRQPFERLLLSE